MECFEDKPPLETHLDVSDRPLLCLIQISEARCVLYCSRCIVLLQSEMMDYFIHIVVFPWVAESKNGTELFV